jgi:hypothetical protein
MPLDPSKLQGDLRAIFQNPPTDVGQTGQRWAQAYVNYAGDAITLQGGSPVGLDAGKPLLAQTLATLFAIPLSPPPATAANIAAALTAFWFLPPVATSDPGIVTAVAGTALLATALVTVWTANVAAQASADQSAAAIAAAMDAFTRTVIVTIPPVPIIGPLS